MKLYTTFLPFPPSVNSAYGGGSGQQRFKSTQYKNWEKYSSSVYTRHPTISEAIRVVYTFFFPDRRTRDLGNYEKVVSDFLVNKRIIEDDGTHIVRAIDLRFGGYDRTNPRAEVDIYQWGKK